MVERLVDVLGKNGNVIHTYPITLAESDAADDARYEAKALEAAANGQLVLDADLDSLTAKIHVSRGGPLALYGDTLANDSQTKVGLGQAVRERAYLLWEQDGRPEGGQKNTGTELSTNISANVPMCYGNKREAPKVERRNTGIAFLNSRPTDHCRAAQRSLLPKLAIGKPSNRHCCEISW